MTDIPKSMRAVEISTPGGPEVLKLTERPTPIARENEVLLTIEAAGVNRPDVLQRMGMYPPPPGATDIPGLEAAGVVAAIGKNVSGIKVGDKILFGKYSGSEVKIDGDEYLIMREDDVLGIIG